MNSTITTLLFLVMATGSFAHQQLHSLPNDRILGGKSWSIEDYRINALKDSVQAVGKYNSETKVEFYKPKEKPVAVKKQGWFTRNTVDSKGEQREIEAVLKRIEREKKAKLEPRAG